MGNEHDRAKKSENQQLSSDFWAGEPGARFSSRLPCAPMEAPTTSMLRRETLDL
jgi:hypothetical protein